jgi:hypothetical protein
VSAETKLPESMPLQCWRWCECTRKKKGVALLWLLVVVLPVVWSWHMRALRASSELVPPRKWEISTKLSGSVL